MQGVHVHRRRGLRDSDVTRHHGIPVTTPACTLIDLAPRLSRPRLERAINEADRLDLIHPERLRAEVDQAGERLGVASVLTLLDRQTFVYTESHLEQALLPLIRRAGLPRPQTQRRLGPYRVDFYWPELGLVVETDGARYHRTASQQTAAALRSQSHAAAGLLPIPITHAQIRHHPDHVVETLLAVASRQRNLRGTRP